MGKAIMFLAFLWLVVSLAGGVMQGSVTVATTALTADITSTDTTIPVISTDGFADTGFITIIDERIAYSAKTATTFIGTLARPMVRGASGTEADAHSENDNVRTTEGAMLNQSLGYNIAVMTDASGTLAFVTAPIAFFSLLVTFFILPISFVGTDLEILTVIWGIICLGILIALTIMVVGGRRV